MYEIYTVKDNDTVDGIGELFQTNADVIYQLNGIKEIRPNMQIVVPKRMDSNYLYYTVQKGDSPYEIAKKYGVDYRLLLLINGLDDNDYIYPNQTLLIPKNDISLYITKMNDTVRGVMNSNHISFEEMMKENENIYLSPEQIIVFRKK